jgi:hypothetical protein
VKRTPLLRRTPLATRSAMPRGGSSLARVGRLVQVSPKRRAVNQQRAKVLAQLRAGQDWCTACGLVLPLDGHELLSRGRGGSITDPSNICLLCRFCHTYITEHPAWAEANGWALKTTASERAA